MATDYNSNLNLLNLQGNFSNYGSQGVKTAQNTSGTEESIFPPPPNGEKPPMKGGKPPQGPPPEEIQNALVNVYGADAEQVKNLKSFEDTQAFVKNLSESTGQEIDMRSLPMVGAFSGVWDQMSDTEKASIQQGQNIESLAEKYGVELPKPPQHHDPNNNSNTKLSIAA